MKHKSRALILSGGAFRGAIQLPVIEHLFGKQKYDAVYGVSVGSINGAMFAQHDLKELRDFWENVDGVDGFLRAQWYWPFKGYYSMKPLREKLEGFVSLERIKIPFYAGVVSFTDGEYRNLCTDNMTKDYQLWDAVQASSCMAAIMKPEYLEIDGEMHLGADGGFRNIFPIPQDICYENLDVVSCTPIDRMKMKKKFEKNDILNLAMRGIDILEDEVFDKDLVELSNCIHNKVRIFYPDDYPGDALDASQETIKMRFKLGEEAIKNPLILKS